MLLDETVAQIWNDWRAQDPARQARRVSWIPWATQVEFDAEHLRRVLVNLLDNALRYMGPEPDSLSVTTRNTPAGQVSLQVWSDGPHGQIRGAASVRALLLVREPLQRPGPLYCRELCQRHGASISYQRLNRPHRTRRHRRQRPSPWASAARPARRQCHLV